MFTKVLVSLFTKTSVFTYYSITIKLSANACANYINYLLVINSVPYTAKLSRGKTFAVGIEKDRSRENVHGSSISQ